MEKRLLLIQSDRDLRILVKEILEISFHVNVMTAGSSPESLRYLKTNEFDMIVSDYRLHRVPGLSFFEEILEAPYNQIPLILYTSETEIDLNPSQRLKIVRKPDFKTLMQEVQSFGILSNRQVSSGPQIP